MDVVVEETLLGTESEAEVSSWLVEDGALVTAGQPVASLETGKVVVDVLAPSSGTLRILAAVGRVVEPGAVIATVS